MQVTTADFQAMEDITRISWRLPRTRAAHRNTAAFMPRACGPCSAGPSGKSGHETLRYTALSPDEGRGMFRCGACGESWVRTVGMTCRFVWTRSTKQAA